MSKSQEIILKEAFELCGLPSFYTHLRQSKLGKEFWTWSCNGLAQSEKHRQVFDTQEDALEHAKNFICAYASEAGGYLSVAAIKRSKNRLALRKQAGRFLRANRRHPKTESKNA